MALRALTVLILASHAAFLPAALPVTPAKELSPKETALDAHIDRHLEDKVGFLERVVNINSETMDHEGVRRVARIFEKELESLGFATRWIDLRDSSFSRPAYRYFSRHHRPPLA